ncbi:hypothetical protein WAI453_002771 [Rhynchosporium graminicola]
MLSSLARLKTIACLEQVKATLVESVNLRDSRDSGRPIASRKQKVPSGERIGRAYRAGNMFGGRHSRAKISLRPIQIVSQ